MSPGTLTSVAIPVRNGARDLPAVLSAIRSQRIGGNVEIVVVDSGSTDGSVALCETRGRASGARSHPRRSRTVARATG